MIINPMKSTRGSVAGSIFSLFQAITGGNDWCLGKLWR